MQFSSSSINRVLTYNYITDKLKSNIIDNINKICYTYYDNLSNLNICRILSNIHFNARRFQQISIILLITLYLKINFTIIVITE